MERDRLPSDLVPDRYHLFLHDFRFAPEWSYEGLVKISCQVRNPVKVLHINAKNLSISRFHVEDNNGAIIANAIDIAYDQAQERATARLSDGLSVGADVCLCIAFTAPIGDTMAGCYRSKYSLADGNASSTSTRGKDQYMISTQFQACEARRAFPCFDEPNLKASFVLEIEASSDLVLLSNMPVKSRTSSGQHGLTRAVFEESPKMSTYLLAWAMGDFDYVEAFTEREYQAKRLPVRVYATRGLRARCQFALDHAVRSLDLLSQTLGADYPLPKCDLLVVHELSHGAMENWGLVTFRPTALLCDPDYSDSANQQQIAYVLAHELSHQWFGNLVTMDWWDDLWLNEGFATYIGWWVVDHLHPEWQVWVHYLVEDFQQGLHLDSLQSSHPVQAGVRNTTEIIQLFDQISYLKGSAIIRMLSAYLGADTFFRGVSQYIESHKYGNASTADLWRALGQASGHDVDAVMSTWVQRTGYPLLSCGDEEDACHIRQTRYTMIPSQSNGESSCGSDSHGTIWPTPITYESKHHQTKKMLLETREGCTELSSTPFQKLDPGHHGFYRTFYSPKTLQRLFEVSLSIEDRIGLLGDVASFVLSGHLTTPTLLSLLLRLQDETSSSVWALVGNAVQKVQVTFAHHKKITIGLQKFVWRLIGQAILKLRCQDNSGNSSYWTVMAGDTHEAISLRKHLLELAVLGAQAPDVIAEGKILWSRREISRSRDAIHPDLVGLILKLAAEQGGAEAYEKIKASFLAAGATTVGQGDKPRHKVPSSDMQESHVAALAHTKDNALLRDAMNFALHSGELAMSETYVFATAIAENPTAQDIAWTLIRHDWDQGGVKQLREIGRGKGIDHWMKRSLRNVSNHRIQDDMAAFFSDKDTQGFDRGLAQVLEQIEINARYRQRDEEVLEAWLHAQGYLD